MNKFVQKKVKITVTTGTVIIIVNWYVSIYNYNYLSNFFELLIKLLKLGGGYKIDQFYITLGQNGHGCPLHLEVITDPKPVQS